MVNQPVCLNILSFYKLNLIYKLDFYSTSEVIFNQITSTLFKDKKKLKRIKYPDIMQMQIKQDALENSNIKTIKNILIAINIHLIALFDLAAQQRNFTWQPHVWRHNLKSGLAGGFQTADWMFESNARF